ncbi:hypothetical protein HY386_02440 [Candidatus Daviesbacteria bacterium]|nr:hypothetical protein [Candidatus Daviesbacteria bacterium]
MARRSKRNFIATILIIALLLYGVVFWILPIFIGGLGLISSFVNSPSSSPQNISDSAVFAPPVLNIPYEATNTGQIDIKGYATPAVDVKIYVNNKLADELRASGDGSFISQQINLKFGLNEIYGKTADDQNHESLPSKVLKITFDDETPRLTIFEPEDGKVIQGERKIKVSGETEPEAKVYINGTRVVVDSEGKFSSMETLSDGENTFTTKAVDAASNTTEIIRKITFNP